MNVNYSEIEPQTLTTRDNKEDGLKEWQFYAYGVGHFMNDLGGAIYFNYLFYFLKRIVKTEAAPAAFLAGQITDGIATPIVGFLSDRTQTRFGTPFILMCRTEITMVRWWLHNLSDWLLPHLPKRQEALARHNSGVGTLLLYCFHVYCEHWVGSCPDISHEPGAIPHLFPKEKSKNLIDLGSAQQ